MKSLKLVYVCGFLELLQSCTSGIMFITTTTKQFNRTSNSNIKIDKINIFRRTWISQHFLGSCNVIEHLLGFLLIFPIIGIWMPLLGQFTIRLVDLRLAGRPNYTIGQNNGRPNYTIGQGSGRPNYTIGQGSGCPNYTIGQSNGRPNYNGIYQVVRIYAWYSILTWTLPGFCSNLSSVTASEVFALFEGLHQPERERAVVRNS